MKLSTEARELVLYLENDGPSYAQAKKLRAHAASFVKRGGYDHKKAQLLWLHFVEQGARRYGADVLRYEGGPLAGLRLFRGADRRQAAAYFATKYGPRKAKKPRSALHSQHRARVPRKACCAACS